MTQNLKWIIHNTYTDSLYVSSYKQRNNITFDVISDKLYIMQNLYLCKKLLMKLKWSSKINNTNICSTRNICNRTAVSVSSAQSSLLWFCHDKLTWKPAPHLCWEKRFCSGGAQLLIRYLPSWYHAKPSLTLGIHWTIYPTSLHGSLCPSETSSCLWVGNQWQIQLMSQKLTMVSEHNKAPQNLSQLYLLLF